jgi:RecA-family ATPase
MNSVETLYLKPALPTFPDMDSFINPRQENFQHKIRSTWTELASLDTTEAPMLWDGLLPSNEIAILAGMSGLGKSTIARQLACAIARGDETFLSRKLNAPHKRAIYISCEDGRIKTARILKNSAGQAHEGLIMYWGSMMNLEDILGEIDSEMSQSPVDLVVIDSLRSKFGKGNINDNSDVERYFEKFAPFSEDTVLLFLHHIRKSAHKKEPEQGDILGGDSVVGRARAVLMLTATDKRGTERFLHMEKENDISDEFKTEALVLNFDSVTKLYSTEGTRKPVSEIGRNLIGNETEIEWSDLFEPEGRLSNKQISRRIEDEYAVSRATAQRRVRDAIKSGHITKDKDRMYHCLTSQLSIEGET